MTSSVLIGGEDWGAAVGAAGRGEWLILRAAWSAVEPKRGEYDEGLIEADRRALIAARKQGVEVILVAHSGGLPDWQIERDGWLDGDALAGFGCYVDRLAHAYGELVRHWVGLWEPLGEAAIYEADRGKVARTLLDVQSSAWLHLRKAPGPGGAGTVVGVAERFDVVSRRRDRLGADALGRIAGALGRTAAEEAWRRSAPHALVAVLSSGRLAPPFGAVGELSGGTAASDFTVALRPTVQDLHQIWLTGRAVFVLGDVGVAEEAAKQGVRVLGAAPYTGSSTTSNLPKS